MDFKGYTFDRIKELFFSEEKNQINLKQGEMLMEAGGLNDRLYLVEEGLLIAYVPNQLGGQYEVFRASPGMFAGVYSFFSGTHLSKTTIIAEVDTKLTFLEAEPFEEREDTEVAIRFFLPVILSDLSARMETAQKMATEKEEAITHLLKAEKMATLGQLAAGLAHELNNAVGVLKSKSDWLSIEMENYFNILRDNEAYDFYKKGLKEGHKLTTREVRKRKGEIEKKLGLSSKLAKKAARSGYDIQDLSKYKERLASLISFWEIGTAFHDMGLASKHASAVVQSVKELGAGSAERKSGMDVNKTIRDALTLIQSALRQVEVATELEESIYTEASSGELVQVWINLFKNACESMVNSHTEDPLLKVISEKTRKWITVRVIDNGPGIPEHLLTQIFQPNMTTKKGGLSFGLGLGLPISLNIIEDYDGEISVNSKPGHTEFIVKLPVD